MTLGLALGLDVKSSGASCVVGLVAMELMCDFLQRSIDYL